MDATGGGDSGEGRKTGEERIPFDHSLSIQILDSAILSPRVHVYTFSDDGMTDTTQSGPFPPTAHDGVIYARRRRYEKDPARQKTGDTKEGYYIGREVEPGSAEHGLPLRGPNNWPDEAALGLASFRGPMQSYYDHVCDLARRLMPSFEAALGLEKNFFSDKFSHPTALLRPLKYAAAASDPKAGIMAAGAHSDYGVLTILAIDGTPGLQVRKEKQGTTHFKKNKVGTSRLPAVRQKLLLLQLFFPRSYLSTLVSDPDRRRQRRVEGGRTRPRRVRVQRRGSVRALDKRIFQVDRAPGGHHWRAGKILMCFLLGTKF